MNGRRLLYLHAQRLSAYAWQRGALVDEGGFDLGDSGLAAFRAYLKAHADSRFQLLANPAEEGFQVELIPFLHGRERQALIGRRINQHFQGTPLSTSVSLGYEKSRRKNERILLSAMTNPGQFEPWLAATRSAEVALAGVYSLSQLGAPLLRRLGCLPERCLLLSMHNQVIRESLLIGGRTLFSRIAPVLDSSIAGIATSFATEAIKLQQYLLGQRQIDAHEPLPVFILAHPQAVNTIRGICFDASGMVFDVLDSHRVADRIGLKTYPQDSRSELVFLHLLATDPPARQFAAENVRHDHHLRQIRQALVGASSLALCGALLFAAEQAYETRADERESSELSVQADELTQRYREISAGFPQLAVDHDTLRKLVGRFEEQQQLQRRPDAAYRQVSRALAGSPGIDLDGIEWQLTRTESEGNGAPPASQSVLARPGDEVMLVRGSVRVDGTPSMRTILDTFDAFTRALQAEPGLQVEVVQRPFDIEPGQALRISDREGETPRPHAFAIRLVWKSAA